MDSSRPKHIIEGFSEDLERIKKEFLELSPNLRLEDFLSYWKGARMDCLFANRFDPRELLEMITELNQRLVPIVANQFHDLASRIVALYLLLSLCAKQPDRMRRRIRLTCEDAISLNQLCEVVEQQKSHNDVKFTWNYLKKSDAIDFVEDRLIYGPSLLTHRGSGNTREASLSQSDPIAASKLDTDSFIGDKIEPALSELDSMCSNYSQLKNILKLDNINDATVDIESNGTLEDHMDQAKNLLREYKSRPS